MVKARAWRNSGKVRKRTSAAATLSQTAMPTRERLAKATDQFEIAGTGAHRIVRMLDAPLEQMGARRQLTEIEFQTLVRLRWHWFQGHQGGSLKAVTLDRVSAIRDYGTSESEQELWHREMLEAALQAITRLEREIIASVVFDERTPNEVGAVLGYQSPYRGRQAVLDLLRSAAHTIMSVWLTKSET